MRWTLLFILSTIFVNGYTQTLDEPKPLGTQNELAVKEGLKKIGLIPYYLAKKVIKNYQIDHNDLMYRFFNEEPITLKEFSENEFFILNYDQHYEAKPLFNFNAFLNGRIYKENNCKEICPKSFRLLNLNPAQHKPSMHNYLSFRNITEDFADSYIKQSGYCWGYSSVLDDFHHLAFFDPENRLSAIVPENEVEKINYYKNLIDDIVLKEKATVIPFYSSIREFAEVKEFKAYLKIRVAKKWAKNAVKPQSIVNVTLDGHKMKLRKTNELLEEIKYRLLTHQTPRIIFAALGDSTWSHVLNIYGLQRFKDGTHRLYMFESNYYPEKWSSEHAYYIEIDPQGNASYAPIATSRIGKPGVGRIKFSFEDEDSNVKYVKSLEKFCKKISGCQK